MIVSVEVPVFKGGWLQRCIDSVLYQSSPHWHLSLLWDGGDGESRRILEQLERRQHPRVTVHFAENRGIARARRFLTEHSRGEYILPLDDDDALPFHAVESFLAAAASRPWASVIRADRRFIDENGKIEDLAPWFAFEPRHYQHGMVTDLSNHAQPTLIRRSAYERTSGWEGFEDFRFAGEDCDLYLKLEEVGSIELLPETLYYYRLHGERASLVLTDEAAFEMWRRLADKTIARIGLPLRRTNDRPPFRYERLTGEAPSLEAIDFVLVADPEQSQRFAEDRARRALAAGGVPEDAVHQVTRAGTAHLDEAFARTTRPIVCLLDLGVEVDDAAPFQSLLAMMVELGADLAAPKIATEDGFILCADPGFAAPGRPDEAAAGEWDEGQHDGVTNALWLAEKLVLVRREVAAAVGGFDAGFETERAAMVDFCLKARQRDFRCGYIGAVGFTSSGPDARGDRRTDLARLEAKWAAHPRLFER
ncbi:MAG: glycosyltransferase [Myxococcota bacterium]|nr:glycosyltransferase [Myxococcota bacterium]